MKIDKFITIKEGQQFSFGDRRWSVARLIHLSKDFKVMSIPLDHLNIYNTYENLTLRQMCEHINSVNDSDLSFPIILDEDGQIMDGRYRIMKAIISGKKTIKAVRFDINPMPCSVGDV